MRMKPKTARRLALLTGVVVLGAGAFVGLVVVRGMQNAKLEAGLRVDGMQAHDDGRHIEGLTTLGRYLRRVPDDAEALLAYAECRLAVEEASGRHVREAIGVYQRYVDLRPDDRDARMTLLTLYNRGALFIEARQAAKDLRPELSDVTGEHADVLFEEATALLGLSRIDESFTEVVDALSRCGDETGSALLTLEGLARSGEDPSGYAQALLESNPDDPRWMILDALVRTRDADERQRQAAVAQVCAAFAIDPDTGEALGALELTEPLVIREGVGALDRLGRFDLSVAALLQATSTVDDIQLDRLLARRLVQANQFQTLIDHFQWEDVRQVDTELLAFRAIAELGLDDTREAGGLIEELASREDADFRARAWASALRLATPDGAETLATRVSLLRQALETYPGEPMLLNMLATSLAEMGREDEAIDVWTSLVRAPEAVGWVAPRLKLAQELLATGQPLQAIGVTNLALSVNPGNALANAIMFEAMAQAMRSGAEVPWSEADVLAHVTDVRARVAEIDEDGVAPISDRLLVAHCRLLCSYGHTDDARAMISEAISGLMRPSERALHALSSLSRAYELGLESEILAAASESFGPTPGVVFAKAQEVAIEEGPDAALALFDDMAEADDPENERAWSIARAKLHESLNMPDEAIGTWKSLVAAHPDDLDVMRLVLESPTAIRDWELIEDAAGAYRTLTSAREGDESVLVATARAKALLYGRPSRRERDEAIVLLERAATHREGAVEIRRLLAGAHLLSDPSRDIHPDLSAAARELEAASHLAPGDTTVALELAQVLQQRREFVGAKEILERLANDESLSTPIRLRGVRMLIDQGEEQSASRALSMLADATIGDAETTYALASAYERLGDHRRALSTFEELAGMQPRDAMIVAATCAAFERAGRADLVLRMIEQLEGLGLSAAELAYFHGWRAEQAGRSDDAIEQYRASIAHDPSDRRPHVALVSLLLEQGNVEDASSAAQAALASVPEDPSLNVLIEQARFAASAQGADDLASLIAAMRRDPNSVRLAEALDEIRKYQDAGDLELAESLRELTLRHRDTLAVQLFGAARLARLDRELIPEAVAIAEQAMRTFPDAPEPARLAAELNMSLGRWDAMIAAARAWRQRDVSEPIEADLAIGQAQLRLGQPAKAIDTLRPHVRSAGLSLSSAVDHGIINVYTQALVAQGRIDDALVGLEPLLARSATIRALVALPLVSALAGDPDAAEAWLEQVRAQVPPDAAEEQVAVAAALSSLGQRVQEPDRTRLVREALGVLHALVASDQATPLVLESIGKMHHMLGELDAAEAAYWQAIAANADLIDANNNLAVILLDRGGDPVKAIELATHAVALAGPGSLAELDTLAGAQEALAERHLDQGLSEPAQRSYADAADIYARMLAIDPGQPRVTWSLARTSEKAGRVDAAIKAYEQVLATGKSMPELIAGAENNLALLLLKAERSRADVERAYSLASSAASGRDEASFHDTLGRACLAVGKSDQAIEAFREALRLRPNMIDAMLGLADALLKGDADAQAEANSLIETVERMIEDGADVDPETLRMLERLNNRFSSVD